MECAKRSHADGAGFGWANECSTALYCAVSLVITGMVVYSDLDPVAPLAEAFGRFGLYWAQIIVAVGALLVRASASSNMWRGHLADRIASVNASAHAQALTTTILAGILGMPRIFLAMARDGLLFQAFRKIHPRFETPFLGTLVTGFIGALDNAAGWWGLANDVRWLCTSFGLRRELVLTVASCCERSLGTAALLSLMLDIGTLADMVSIGTLFAFVYVVS